MIDDISLDFSKIKNFYCPNQSRFKLMHANNFSEGFKLMSLNARSCSGAGKFDDFKLFLSDLGVSFEVVIVGETWFKESLEGMYRLDGYNAHFSSRGEEGYGGLAVYVRSDIRARSKSYSSRGPNPFDIIGTQMTSSDGRRLSLISAYRPPRQENLQSFLDSLEQALHESRSEISLFTGDINIDTLIVSTGTARLNDLMNSFGIHLINNHITRPASGTKIDHVGSSIATEAEHIIYTIETDLDTDHNAIACKVAVGATYSSNKWQLKKINGRLCGWKKFPRPFFR